MPNFLINGPSSVARVLDGNDDGLVTRDGTLAVLNDNAIEVSSVSNDLMINGSVEAVDGFAIATPILEAGGLDLIIGAGGNVASNTHAVNLTIDQGLSILSAGSIIGGADAIRAGSSARAEILNSGAISAFQNAILLYLNDANAEIVNSGTITSVNDGIDLGNSRGATRTVQVINSGEITAGDHAFAGSDELDAPQVSLINSGTITGDIYLGRAGDLYNGRNGFLDGRVEAGRGNDIVHGGAWGEYLDGEEGNDTVNGGGGDDTIRGGSGVNTLRGQDGNDSVNGGTGDDMIRGGAGDDTLTASNGDDDVGGGTGADNLTGGAGEDTLSGGDGDDTIDGGDDDDVIAGGRDDDLIDAGQGADTVRGGAGDDTVDGGTGGDSLSGGNDNDRLLGDSGLDFLDGGRGDDTLLGGADQDTLLGGSGNDVLDGGGRSDRLDGGAGDDTMTGGSRADTFVFDLNAGDDVVTDWTNGDDLIDLSAYGLNNFNQLDNSGAISATPGGVLIDLDVIGGSGSILLDGATVGQLNGADFIF